MKKFMKILILQLLIMFFAIKVVNAADNPCRISLSTSKTTLKPGDEITINIYMSDITLQEGINNISAIFNYPEDVFDIVLDESDEAEEQIAIYSESLDSEGSIAMLYIGANDTTSTRSDWNALLYDEGTGEKGLLMYTSDRKKTSQNIAKITLKVKENAPKTSAKFELKTIAAYDANNNEQNVNNTSITFTIEGEEIIRTNSKTCK